jgi:hypothetical protein
MHMFPPARGLAAALLALTAIGASAASAAQADPAGFAPRSFISSTLAGGEPLVLADTKHGTLIYTSHEGTTHLYRNGLASIPVNWLFAYRDQVNTWYSKDNGKTWALSQLAGTGTNATGFNARPDQNLGFSDPDLTQDGSGRVYNTGIDLANDAIFSTSDGGVTWDKGTALCHDGDRPWLAAVGADNAFLSTNTEESGHEVFETTDGGNSCSTPFVDVPGAAHGIPDPGGDGKLFWNPVLKELVEPNITSTGLGVATWKRGQTAFTQQPKVYKGNIFAHWPSLGIDKAGTLYMVWDTAPTGTFLGGQGCSDSVTGDQPNTQVAPPNAIEYASSTDDGRTWSAPVVVSPPVTGHIQFWPWLAAGDAGRISIVWYRTDRAVDIDCAPVSLTIKETTVLHADGAAPSHHVVNASNGPIHYGTVCQGGTTCVATGEDRRLGDFFTNAPDANGCVMIASGDTEQGNNVTFTTAPFSLPIIIRQNSGPSLDSGVDCAHPTG